MNLNARTLRQQKIGPKKGGRTEKVKARLLKLEAYLKDKRSTAQ